MVFGTKKCCHPTKQIDTKLKFLLKHAFFFSTSPEGESTRPWSTVVWPSLGMNPYTLRLLNWKVSLPISYFGW